MTGFSSRSCPLLVVRFFNSSREGVRRIVLFRTAGAGDDRECFSAWKADKGECLFSTKTRMLSMLLEKFDDASAWPMYLMCSAAKGSSPKGLTAADTFWLL